MAMVLISNKDAKTSKRFGASYGDSNRGIMVISYSFGEHHLYHYEMQFKKAMKLM
jgi:hypothetical protein